jgi:hypothetical protein
MGPWLSTFIKFRFDNNAHIIDQVRVTRDQCCGWVGGWIHYLYPGWFNNLPPCNYIGISAQIGVYGKLITPLKLIEITKDFPKDIIVSREYKIAIFSRISSADYLSNPLFKLLPPSPLDYGGINTYSRYLNPCSMFMGWGRNGDSIVGLNKGL